MLDLIGDGRVVAYVLAAAILLFWVLLATAGLWLPWLREWRTCRYLRRQLRRRR